ncbi:hypothetical protein [Actinoplanes sp. GCM10030250]|uniref:hypothetical protein n=1 Tax=Actinoplanes sp. GCM10030250 TaxID=3273376 RepID=UPI00360A3EDA
METARPSQLPSWLLITITCLLSPCALPAALFFVLSGVSGDSGPSAFVVLGLGVPALVAFPAAVWLWSRARRVRSAGRAWLLALLGLLLVVGASTPPVTILGGAFVEEWQETQPGGRGYQPIQER